MVVSLRRLLLALPMCALIGGVGCGGGGSSSSGADGSETRGGDGDGDATGDGDQPDATCVADADANQPSPATATDPAHAHTVTGANGSFTDMCDADGNLVEYVCEVSSECSDPPNPACTYFQSGDVGSEMFDCAGTCMNGTCVARCPAAGDTLEYQQVGEEVVFENLTDGRAYACALVFDSANDSYDCTVDPSVGATTIVFGLGLMSEWCTGTQSINIATGEPQQCSYACNMVPG